MKDKALTGLVISAVMVAVGSLVGNIVAERPPEITPAPEPWPTATSVPTSTPGPTRTPIPTPTPVMTLGAWDREALADLWKGFVVECAADPGRRCNYRECPLLDVGCRVVDQAGPGETLDFAGVESGGFFAAYTEDGDLVWCSIEVWNLTYEEE